MALGRLSARKTEMVKLYADNSFEDDAAARWGRKHSTVHRIELCANTTTRRYFRHDLSSLSGSHRVKFSL
jgi:hypothetical protein